MNSYSEQNILIGACGSISVVQFAYQLSHLRRYISPSIRVVMSEAACGFIRPESVSHFSGSKVIRERDMLGDPECGHIALTEWADRFIILPATANTICKIAHGIGDTAVTECALAYEGELVIAPGMNAKMWAQPAVRDAVALLRSRGHDVIEPEPAPAVATSPGVAGAQSASHEGRGVSFSSVLGALSCGQVFVNADGKVCVRRDLGPS